MDVSEQLLNLAKARDAGLLTADEFEAQKRALLARGLATVPPGSGGFAPPTDELTALGAYDLLARVGDGGMGTVYRGRHRVGAIAARQGGDVAVKTLHPALARDPAFVERFRSEAEALAALDHPNIVKVYDVVEEGGRIALVMEWVPGFTLSELIGRHTGPMPWERAQKLVRPLLAGVAHAHERSVVHRDIKPENIRVTPEGVLKVLDFGIARLGESRGATKTGAGMGSVDYMAPEQFTDARHVDARADVYALGMTLYEMVAGRLAWEPSDTEFGVLQRKSQGEIPPPTAFYPSIPPWVVEAIMGALVVDPAQRLPSVHALESALFPASPKKSVWTDNDATDPGRRGQGAGAVDPRGAPTPGSAVAPAAAPSKRGVDPAEIHVAEDDVELVPDGPTGNRVSPRTSGRGWTTTAAAVVAGIVGLGGLAMMVHRAQVHATACEDLEGLRTELRDQKTIAASNTPEVLDGIRTRGRTALELCPESETGRSVLALADVWRAGWQMTGAKMKQEDLEVVKREVDAVRTLATPEAQMAVLATDTAACRLLPEDSAERAEYCTDISESQQRVANLAVGDGWGWLRVEAAWAVAMRGLAEAEASYKKNYYSAAQAWATGAISTCAGGLGDLPSAPVNGIEMLETCMKLAGYALDVQSYYTLTDQWLNERSKLGKALDDRALGMVYTFAAPQCRTMKLGRDRLPAAPSGVRLGSGGWTDWCREVGGAALGCSAKSAQPKIPNCTCCLYVEPSRCYQFQRKYDGTCPVYTDANCVASYAAPPRVDGVPWAAVDTASPARADCPL